MENEAHLGPPNPNMPCKMRLLRSLRRLCRGARRAWAALPVLDLAIKRLGKCFLTLRCRICVRLWEPQRLASFT